MVVGEIEKTDDCVVTRGDETGTARGNEREQGDGLFVDGNERAVNRDDNFVGKEDPLRLEERVVERANAAGRNAASTMTTTQKPATDRCGLGMCCRVL